MLGRTRATRSPAFAWSSAVLWLLAIACDDATPAANEPDASQRQLRDAGSRQSPTTESTPTAALDAGMEIATVPKPPCNGLTELCQLEYGEPLQLMTHTSAATQAAAWATVTQNLSIAEQLRWDVPALQLSIYDDAGELSVCAGRCADGDVPLAVVLAEARLFLEQYAQNTLTLFIDAHVSAERLAEQFADAELIQYVFTPEHGESFGTLETLIDAGTRLVVFVDWHSPEEDAGPADRSDGGKNEASDSAPEWLLPVDRWVKQTKVDPTSPGDIDCTTVRGDDDAPLLVLHLHAPNEKTGLPEPEQAQTINSPTFLLDRVHQCEVLHGRTPSFVAVDFVEVGGPQTTLLRLNQGLPPLDVTPPAPPPSQDASD